MDYEATDKLIRADCVWTDEAGKIVWDSERCVAILREHFPEPAPAEQGEGLIDCFKNTLDRAFEWGEADTLGTQNDPMKIKRYRAWRDEKLAEYRYIFAEAAHPQPESATEKKALAWIRQIHPVIRRALNSALNNLPKSNMGTTWDEEVREECRTAYVALDRMESALLAQSPTPSQPKESANHIRMDEAWREAEKKEAYLKGYADGKENGLSLIPTIHEPKESATDARELADIAALIEYVKCPGFERHKLASESAERLESLLAFPELTPTDNGEAEHYFALLDAAWETVVHYARVNVDEDIVMFNTAKNAIRALLAQSPRAKVAEDEAKALREALGDFTSFEYRRGVSCQKNSFMGSGRRCLCRDCIEERGRALLGKEEK